MPLELIIFDCDGVLIESVDAKTRAFAKVGKIFGQEASDALVAYHVKHGGVNRIEKFRWFFAKVLKREPKPGEINKLADLFAEYSFGEVLVAQDVPGVLSVLNNWHGRVPMYVASGAPQLELERILKHLDMARYFEKIYGAPPGKTQLLRGILAESGANPANSIMIGDSSSDMYAAEAVGSMFYGRGRYFEHSEYPWHHDLTELSEYLEDIHEHGYSSY